MHEGDLDLLARRDGRVAQGVREVRPAQRGRQAVEVHTRGGRGATAVASCRNRRRRRRGLGEVGLGRDLVRGLQHVRRAHQVPAELGPELPLGGARQHARRRRGGQASRLRLAGEVQHAADGAARRHPREALQHGAGRVEVALLHRRREEELVHLFGVTLSSKVMG